MNEQEWVRQVRVGDLDAYDQIVHLYMNKIYYLLYRMIRSEEDAKDLAQECFIRAYRNLHQYDTNQKFSSWLYKIAINLCHNELDKRKRRDTQPADDVEGVEAQSPESIYMEKEERLGYQREIDQLPPLYRSVLILRYYEDCNYLEIGEVLGISEQDVRNYLYRAKRKLRTQQSFRCLKEGVSL